MGSPIEAAQAIPGWMSRMELEWLYQVAKRMTSILEVGCFRGRSTYVLLSGCQGLVHVVDCFYCGTMHPFEDCQEYTRPEFDQNVGHFPNLGTVFEGRAEDAPNAILLPAEFDMVFIDCCHDKDPFLYDLKSWAPRTKVLLCGHDLDSATPGIAQGLEEFGILDKVSRGPGSIWYLEK